MKDLTNTTFIIPIRIEHQDRYNNAKRVLSYMNHHLKTNVYIYEVSDDGGSKLDFLAQLTNLNISIINDKYDGVFHRMRYLNILLHAVTTPTVCNYDIDVILMPQMYEYATNLIIDNQADVVYPYGWGNYQAKINIEFDEVEFYKNYNINLIKDHHVQVGPSECGHCVFLSTQVYKEAYGENENFISWGPEDKERMQRFRKLDYRVLWVDGSYVFHFEHQRGVDSGTLNPYAEHNEALFRDIINMTKEDLIKYYTNQDYLTQYDNFLHTE